MGRLLVHVKAHERAKPTRRVKKSKPKHSKPSPPPPRRSTRLKKK